MKIEAEKYQSPNFFSRGEDVPDMIVIHQSRIPASLQKKRYLSADSRDSVHFYITLKGEIRQFVPITEAAAKDVCSSSDPRRCDHWSHSLSRIIREREKDPSSYTVSVEFEGFGSGALTRLQFDAGVKTVKHIIGEIERLYGLSFKTDREHIIGHYKVLPALHPFCPGLDFPMIKLIKACGGV